MEEEGWCQVVNKMSYERRNLPNIDEREDPQDNHYEESSQSTQLPR